MPSLPSWILQLFNVFSVLKILIVPHRYFIIMNFHQIINWNGLFSTSTMWHWLGDQVFRSETIVPIRLFPPILVEFLWLSGRYTETTQTSPASVHIVLRSTVWRPWSHVASQHLYGDFYMWRIGCSWGHFGSLLLFHVIDKPLVTLSEKSLLIQRFVCGKKTHKNRDYLVSVDSFSQ